MREYKEIVADLRGHLLEVPLSLLNDAADAIEKLVAENERLNGIIDVFIKEDTK